MSSLFGFLLKLALAVALAAWLADEPGTAHIVWHNYVIDASAAMLAFAVFALGFAFYLLYRVYRFFVDGPAYWRLTRTISKTGKGQNYLTQGLVAVAAGDAAEAGRLAVAARKALGTTTLTQLLQAQAAQLAGDVTAAKEIFQSLAQDSASTVLGYRGLIMLARRQGDSAEVERLIERLHRLKPDTPWLALMRFDVLVQRQDWNDANLCLAQVAAAQLLDPLLIKSQRAALLVASSQEAARRQLGDQALQLAERAIKQIPGWLPAIINLAQRQADAGLKRVLRRTVEKYWAIMPHPKLAEIYVTPEPDRLDAYKQTEKLCRTHPDNPVSLTALAEAALNADLWGEARRHLSSLVTRGMATQASYRLLAKVERRERGDEAAALVWMAKAADAPPDGRWLCRDCGSDHADWQAACAECGAFNTLDWRKPDGSRPPRQSVPNAEIKRIEWQDIIVP